MFNLLLGVVSDEETNKLLLLLFCVWLLPLANIILTVVSSFSCFLQYYRYFAAVLYGKKQEKADISINGILIPVY